MVKLGICEWMTPYRGTKAIAFAKKAGFNGIQLGDVNSIEDAEILLKESRNQQISIQSIHPYDIQRTGYMLSPLNSEQGKYAFEVITQMIEYCEAMKVPCLMVSSFFATFIKDETDYSIFAEHLLAYSSFAKNRGVRIVYESVLPLFQLKQLLNYVGNDLKICYDITNPIKYRSGEPLKEIPLLIDYIDHFHIKDSCSMFLNPELLGHGICNVKDSLNVIFDNDFDGWMFMENNYPRISELLNKDALECAIFDRLYLKKLYMNTI